MAGMEGTAQLVMAGNMQNMKNMNQHFIGGGGGSPRGGAYYALEIVKALPHYRQLAIDALDRARAMVEAMHKAAP